MLSCLVAALKNHKKRHIAVILSVKLRARKCKISLKCSWWYSLFAREMMAGVNECPHLFMGSLCELAMNGINMSTLPQILKLYDSAENQEEQPSKASSCNLCTVSVTLAYTVVITDVSCAPFVSGCCLT